MACCHHYYLPSEGHESAFAIDVSSITFGHGVLGEAGEHARALGMTRVALFTDATLARLPYVAQVRGALEAAGVDVAVFDEVRVEPTDQSFLAAARFAAEGRFDGYVSVGGGSVIDTCKAANLYATHPAEFLDYVNPPIGAGKTFGCRFYSRHHGDCGFIHRKIRIDIQHLPRFRLRFFSRRVSRMPFLPEKFQRAQE